MQNKKKLSILIIVIAIALIISGNMLIFIDEYQKDVKEKSTYASLIKTSFTSHKMELEDISLEIKDLNIFGEKYYIDFKNNYSNSINKLSLIEEKINKIETTSEMLIYECENREYNDYDIENKCRTIKHNHEAIINAFISIVEKYNKKVDIYNNYISNQKNENEILLKKYQSKNYIKYIDINQDNEYAGKIK